MRKERSSECGPYQLMPRVLGRSRGVIGPRVIQTRDSSVHSERLSAPRHLGRGHNMLCWREDPEAQ